jgi:hypothetical protein
MLAEHAASFLPEQPETLPPPPACADSRRVALAEQAKAPTFHWGDLDPGGLRIFRHLERALAPAGVSLQPHLMREVLLESFGLPGPGERGLKLGDACDSAIAAIWDTVAADPQRRALEQ